MRDIILKTLRELFCPISFEGVIHDLVVLVVFIFLLFICYLVLLLILKIFNG